MSDDLRIYVDLPWDASSCMGTGAYSETMVRALAKAASDATLTLLVPLGSPRTIDLPNVRYASLPATDGLAESTRQISLPAYLDAVQADCLFAPASLVPAVKVCPTVATVHDLAFETHPEHYAPGLREHLARWFPSTLAAADRIVAISEPVKQDLLFRKRVSPERVAVIEQPIREIFREHLSGQEHAAEVARLGVAGPYFFHVSNLSVHKNMTFGMHVFAEFLKRHPESRHQLLFAGGSFGPSAPPDLIAVARSLGIGDRVRYVGRISDTTLKVLYQGCSAFLFPSLVEGWGLPVAEARAMGAPVLASPHVPSAMPDERVELDVAAWIERLESPEPCQGRGLDPAERAGERLLEVIREAVRSLPRRTPVAVQPNFPSSPTVAIRGDWYSPSGFGQAARGVHQSLRSAGMNPIAALVPKDRLQDKRLFRDEVSLRRGLADLWIHHVPPELMDLSIPGRHATYYFWETDRLPSGSAEILSQMDEVWAPSTFVADVLQGGGVTAPIAQIHPPVDTNLFSPGARRAPPVNLPHGFDPSWSVFLYVGTWDPRKRPDVLVRAFTRTFTSHDHALLIVKSYVTGDTARDREILGTWVSAARESDAHVRIIPDILSSAEMADLFRSATAFVTASRGEGYCLPAVQAMSCGKPVIAVNWSAFKDYIAVPVACSVQSVPRDVCLPGYTSEMRWAVIDEADLSVRLRGVHEDRGRACALGRQARDWVYQHASMSVVGQRLRARIQELCRRPVPSQPLEVST